MQRELDTNPGLAARLKRPLAAYLQSIYYDTICFEPAYLRAALESDGIDPGHLVLGSDTPFPLGSRILSALSNGRFAAIAAKQLMPSFIGMRVTCSRLVAAEYRDELAQTQFDQRDNLCRRRPAN